MVDELVNISFDLDYRILQSTNIGKCKQFINNLDYPKLETDDIFSEYEKLIIITKEIISELLNLLLSCDEQRKVYIIT
jgi:hypothetical protein